jgi:signal transduction histidine kinase
MSSSASPTAPSSWCARSRARRRRRRCGSIGSLPTSQGELKNQTLDVTVTEAQPVSVRANRLGLARALRNLMINAATHGRSARVRVEGSEGAKAQVIVEDEGPGIPPELLGQVFEPFFRVDPGRRQDIAGAGLGLTIAREISSAPAATSRFPTARTAASSRWWSWRRSRSLRR